MNRTANTLKKLERLQKAIRHEEPDRVPVSDFFWGGFLKRWREDLGLSPDTDPYEYYDLDITEFIEEGNNILAINFSKMKWI